jgi:heme-degrading monooxygenase HmoA
MVRIRQGLYIQISRYELQNGKSSDLAKKVETHLKDWIIECEGFVSSNLHVSVDGKKMVNYSQWRSLEAFKGYIDHPKHAAFISDIDSFDPERSEADAFELVGQHSIEDEFWSKSRI